MRGPSDGRFAAGWARERATGVLVAAGFAAVVAGSCAAALLPPQLVAQRVAVLAAVVGVFAAFAGDIAAGLATAAIAWLFCNGFLVDRFGVLRWHGRVDLVRLGILCVVALVGTGLGWLIRTVRSARLAVPDPGPDLSEQPVVESVWIAGLPGQRAPQPGQRAPQQAVGSHRGPP